MKRATAQAKPGGVTGEGQEPTSAESAYFFGAKPWKSWVGKKLIQHLLSGRTLQAFRIKRRGALDPARSVKRNAIERERCLRGL